jgi:carbon monoxide dehydrogenase subunit G
VELVNDFRVPLPVEKAFALLTDPERIAPAMPGAQLLSVEGEDFHGAVKVKVGPIVAQYKGKATFQEKDDAAHRAVIRAEGKESRGQGNAAATVTMTVAEDGDGSAVHLATDLTISGKAAQFGRGVLADVSSKLIAQFVRNLETDILAAATAPAEPESAAPESPAPATDAAGDNPTAVTDQEAVVDAPAPAAVTEPEAAPAETAVVTAPVTAPLVAEAAPLDLGAVAFWPLAKRALPVVGAIVLAAVIYLIVRLAQG